MPMSTEIELRNRALIAFCLLTGARDGAIASLKLKHVDLGTKSIDQDAREVNTKFSKSFRTFFFPVGDDIVKVFADWVIFLREHELWGNDDPLFPATNVCVGSARQFEAHGVQRRHWQNAAPIRAIFRSSFVAAGLPYFNPHSFRNALARLGEEVCRTPEEFKAWSQNLGHEKPLTTFLSYGEIECFYEKVIKVKADVAACSYFSYIADPRVVDGELSRALPQETFILTLDSSPPTSIIERRTK
jgi:integrase